MPGRPDSPSGNASGRLVAVSPGWVRWLPLGLVAAGLAVFATSFEGTFILDDLDGIVRNSRIRHLWPLTPLLTGLRTGVASVALATAGP